MAQPQSPGLAPALSHGAQGLWGQSPGTPQFPGAGGHRVQLPTLSQVWSVAGSPHAWIVPAWGPCASSCRGGGDVTLFIAKSWMGWIPWEWGHRDPNDHTGPTGMGFPHSQRAQGNGGPTVVVPRESHKPHWSHSHRDSMGFPESVPEDHVLTDPIGPTITIIP